MVNILRKRGIVIIENSSFKNVLKITMSSKDELGTLDYNIQQMVTSCESPIIKSFLSNLSKNPSEERHENLFSEEIYLKEKNMDDYNKFINTKSLT